MTRRAWGLGLLALAGCGGEPAASVSGTVTYKGKPVTAGSVQFLQADGRVAAADIQPDGSYSLTGAVAGPAKVGVNTPDPAATTADGAATRNPFGPSKAAAPKAAAPSGVRVPEKYADPDSSGLSATLAAGANTHDIKLAD